VKRFRKLLSLLFVALIAASVFTGCSKTNEENNNQAGEPKQEPTSITLATTTSTEDSGLLTELIPVFEKDSNIRVKVIAVGTGQAIELGQRGDADVLLVHARKAEDEFMTAGYGKVREDVMYNDFVIVGPKADPAGMKGLKVDEALTKLSTANIAFISRGDDSGTHKKELGLWEKVGIEPKGDWYKEVGQGMGATLQVADEKQGYTLTDRATYLAQRDNFDLEIMVEGDDNLFNPYGVIAVNPDKLQHVKYNETMKFIEFLTSKKGQDLIGKFGVEKFGQPLFIPDAK